LFLYADEASISISSYTGRTYAPRGKPAILQINSEIGRRLYLASAISPKGELFYQVRENPFDAQAITEFLLHLLDNVAKKKKLMIIWDNASIHDCLVTRNFLQTQPKAKRLHLVKQPTYSPQLNADEMVWSYLKCNALKNSCYLVVKDLKSKVIELMEEMKLARHRIQQFFHHPDLGFI
jgi:transposase